MSLNIAFIGTGIMGAPMAGHLLSAGHGVTVHNRTRSKAESLIARGAKWASSPHAAAQGADFVFINVTDTPDVEAVVNNLLPAARKGMIVIDHSTISPSATQRFAGQLLERGAHLLDAPVSGGDVGARNATLAIMVGGDENAFNAARPLLEKLGKTITHCGPSGSGQLTKIVNQILVAGTLLSVCEALNLAVRSGLDPQKTITAVAGGAAGSWQLQNLGPRMVKGDFAPGFMIDLMQKDLRIVLGAGGEQKLPLFATSVVHQLYSIAQAQGKGRDGTQALFSVLQSFGEKS